MFDRRLLMGLAAVTHAQRTIATLQVLLQRDINGLSDPDRSTRRRSVRRSLMSIKCLAL